MSLPDRHDAGRVILAESGEVFDTADLEQAAALVARAEEIERNARDYKRIGQDALRAALAAAGRTEMLLGDGAYGVEETAGRASYDGDALYAALEAAGLPHARLAELFEHKVRDARELGKLERRHDDYAQAIEAARTRGRGRIVVHRRAPALEAPRAPEAIQERARDLTRAEAEAAERGI